MKEPKRGDVFTKNGIDVCVHFVADGRVFGVKYREGSSDASLYRPMDTYEIPEGFISTFQIPLDEFWRAVGDPT